MRHFTTDGRRLADDAIGHPKVALRAVPKSFIMTIRPENNLSCATLHVSTSAFTKKTKTATEKKKNPKSNFKVGEIARIAENTSGPINPLPVRDTQLTQISIHELADASKIVTDPKVNPDLMGQVGNGETTPPMKRIAIPHHDTLIDPIFQTVTPTPRARQRGSPHRPPSHQRYQRIR